MSSSEVTIEIKESQASKPFIEVFEEDQKLWEVFKFVESNLGEGAMLWNVNSQEIYTTGSKALKKSLLDLGLTGHVTFMGVRKERIPKVPMRLRPIRREAGGGGREAGGGGSMPGSSYAQESEEQRESLDERKERAKQLLQEKREADKVAASEAEKEKEKERRRIGQELMKEKIKKEREEMQKVSESISRRKASKQAELAAIREQIARDKELRKKEKEDSVPAAPSVIKPVTPSVQDGKVKMKIKVADSTILKTFEETDLLSSVADYVKQELQQEVTLSNTYPRKEYKTEDLEQSLASLGLRGSVCLLGRSGAVQNGDTSGTATATVSN